LLDSETINGKFSDTDTLLDGGAIIDAADHNDDFQFIMAAFRGVHVDGEDNIVIALV